MGGGEERARPPEREGDRREADGRTGRATHPRGAEGRTPPPREPLFGRTFRKCTHEAPGKDVALDQESSIFGGRPEGGRVRVMVGGVYLSRSVQAGAEPQVTTLEKDSGGARGSAGCPATRAGGEGGVRCRGDSGERMRSEHVRGLGPIRRAVCLPPDHGWAGMSDAGRAARGGRGRNDHTIPPRAPHAGDGAAPARASPSASRLELGSVRALRRKGLAP